MPASAAIYGAQAANGVVLVTTKNGKEGKAVVSFDGYFGVQNVAKEVNLLNTEQYMMIMDESHRNSTGSGYNWSGYKSIYDANGNLYDVDWLDKMFEDNAQMQSYTLVLRVVQRFPNMPFRWVTCHRKVLLAVRTCLTSPVTTSASTLSTSYSKIY